MGSRNLVWLALPVTEPELGVLGSREGAKVPAFDWTFILALCDLQGHPFSTFPFAQVSEGQTEQGVKGAAGGVASHGL